MDRIFNIEAIQAVPLSQLAKLAHCTPDQVVRVILALAIWQDRSYRPKRRGKKK